MVRPATMRHMQDIGHIGAAGTRAGMLAGPGTRDGAPNPAGGSGRRMLAVHQPARRTVDAGSPFFVATAVSRSRTQRVSMSPTPFTVVGLVK
jgi:hypothetical protein